MQTSSPIDKGVVSVEELLKKLSPRQVVYIEADGSVTFADISEDMLSVAAEVTGQDALVELPFDGGEGD